MITEGKLLAQLPISDVPVDYFDITDSSSSQRK
jgi:hypothetical protein